MPQCTVCTPHKEEEEEEEEEKEGENAPGTRDLKNRTMLTIASDSARSSGVTGRARSALSDV